VAPEVTPFPLPVAPPVTPAEFTAPGARPVPPTPPATLPPLPPAVVPVGGIDGKAFPTGPAAPTVVPAAPPLVPAAPPLVPAAPAKVDLPALPSAVPSAPPAAPLLPAAPSVVPAAPPLVPTAPPLVPTAPALVPAPPAVTPAPPVVGAPVTPQPLVPTPPALVPTPPALVPTPPALIPTPTLVPTPPTVTPTAGVRPGMPDRAPQTTFDVDLHEPKAGDTYESISKAFYNDARYGAALAAYNQGRPLTAGRQVDVPPVHVLRQRHGQLVGTTGGWNPPSDPAPAFRAAGGKRFVVPAGGMSLGTVAHRTLGSQTRWREIYDLNPGVASPEQVPAGTDLRLPPDATVP
jgi:hypothetical protein